MKKSLLPIILILITNVIILTLLYLNIEGYILLTRFYKNEFVLVLFISFMILSYYTYYYFSQYNKKVIELNKKNIELAEVNADIVDRNIELAGLNEALIKEKERVRSAMEVRRNFLSVVSHEIRTPLNAIVGFASFIKEFEPDEKEIHSSVKNIYFSSQHLLLLVNDILDYNKIEDGKLKLKILPFRLEKTFELLESMYKGIVRDKGVELIFNITEEIKGKFFEGDETRINQVLINLLSNATKFTNKGKIILDCKTTSKEGDLWTLNIKVTDTGIGISKEDTEIIFQKFIQVDFHRARKFQGSGLGLAITKSLVELFGSEIKVESNIGKGSSFSFDLILPHVHKKDNIIEKESNIAVLSGKTILVADDNVINRTVVKNFLLRWGLGVVEVNNGREAFNYVLSNKCDIILMDIHMPEVDGFEATKLIRKLNDLHKSQTPIIALSADALFETHEKVKECGMNDYISKPFKPQELKQKILKYSILNLQNLKR
ncbi:MAG: response regulator, partial [Bacteroidota bacterium]